MKTSGRWNIGSIVGKLMLGLVLAAMFGSVNVAPSFGDDNRGHRGHKERGQYEYRERGHGHDRDRYYRGRRVYRQQYIYRERVYIPPPVIYEPPPPPGSASFYQASISAFKGIAFRRQPCALIESFRVVATNTP